MDRSQRSVQDYLSAARREPGISEQEVRAIVEVAPEPRGNAVPRSWWRSILPWGMAALVVGGGATALLTGDNAAPAPVPSEMAVVRTTPLAPAVSPSAPTVSPRVTPADSGSAPAAAPILRSGRTAWVPTARTRAGWPGVSITTSHIDPPRRGIVSNNNRTESNTTEQVDTMNITHVKRFAATAFVTAAVVSAANAFPPAAPAQALNGGGDHKSSPIVERFEQEIGTATYDYWIARLNDYKRTIDRTLSSNDLDRLNKLRVRFAMMINEATVDANVKVKEKSKEKGGKEGTISMSIDGDDIDGMAKIQEFMSIYMEAKTLAGQYHTELKPLQEGVVGDFFTYTDQMTSRVEKFVAENRTELAASEDAKGLLSAREEARTFIDELQTEDGRMMIEKVYNTALEPIIMLYDGAELSLLLQQAAPFAKGVTGLNLPDASVLKQSVPNPASGSVTIPYTLKESSDRTILRLFNSTGALVGTFEQGSRPAGENTINLDVSGYPAGRYLYHLTIQTSKGEQVYSKSMQVVK